MRVSTVMWKFPLPLDDKPHPLPGIIRAAAPGLLRDQLTVWAEADDADAFSARAAYQVFGTGHPIPAGAEYVATVADPPFIWHVFEVAPVIGLADE
jgi:hypothetical protein